MMTQKTTLSPVTEHELLGPCVPALPIDQEQRYLLGSLEEAALEAVEDIDGTFVVVLQRGSHHHFWMYSLGQNLDTHNEV